MFVVCHVQDVCEIFVAWDKHIIWLFWIFSHFLYWW